MTTEPELIKVCLTNQGDDTETPWAHDLGPAPATSPPGSRKVRLVNVPFMHAKPTWGDVIIVSPVSDAFPTWDRAGVPWKQISSKILEDGGRWAMIVDYAPHHGTAAADAFMALARACDGQRVVCEGAWDPRDNEPGRTYLAVLKDMRAEKVMDILRAGNLPMDLIQVHPEAKPVSTKNGASPKPIKAGAVPAVKVAKAAPATKKAAPTKPASKKAAATRPAAKKVAAKKPAAKKPAANKPKPAAKKPAAKKPAAKKPAAKKPPPKKPAKKPAAKRR